MKGAVTHGHHAARSGHRRDHTEDDLDGEEDAGTRPRSFAVLLPELEHGAVNQQLTRRRRGCCATWPRSRTISPG